MPCQSCFTSSFTCIGTTPQLNASLLQVFSLLLTPINGALGRLADNTFAVEPLRVGTNIPCSFNSWLEISRLLPLPFFLKRLMPHTPQNPTRQIYPAAIDKFPFHVKSHPSHLLQVSENHH